MMDLGLHNGEAWFPNQEGQVNVQDGIVVITWAKREETEGDGSCWEVGRHHPYPINGDFPTQLPCLKVNGGRRVG